MKKGQHILYYLLMLTGILSCQPQMDDNRQEIQLQASFPQTKASEMTFPANHVISLAAYYESATGFNGNYFTGSLFTKQADSWKATPSLYWPLGEGKMSFLGLAADATESDILQQIEWGKDNCTKGASLMLPEGHCLYNELLCSHIKEVQHHDNINMQFQHTQACIDFSITSDIPDIFMIESIIIKNTYINGQFTTNEAVFSTYNWSFRNARRHNITLRNIQNVILSTDNTKAYIYLPEQQQCTFIINYLQRGSTSTPWSSATRQSFEYKPSNNDEWYYGKKYHYTINMSTTEITIKVGIEAWVDIDIETPIVVTPDYPAGAGTEDMIIDEFDPWDEL